MDDLKSLIEGKRKLDLAIEQLLTKFSNDYLVNSGMDISEIVVGWAPIICIDGTMQRSARVDVKLTTVG